MKKPAQIIYGLNDKPPLLITIFNAIQLVALISINIVYPILIFRMAGMPVDVVENLLAIGMLVLGAVTFLQVLRIGPIGSGYMCPGTFTATFLAPSILAVKAGGLPLVFGMTAFAGLIELIVAPLLNRLRAIFPPEISGLVIFMIGVSGGIVGVRTVFGPTATPTTENEWIVGGITLAAMVALNVWGVASLRMLCALLGLMIGYVAAYAYGLFEPAQLQFLAAAPWVGLPRPEWHGLAFDIDVALPFAIASMAVAMKAAGTITVCQRVNDADWVRPDMKNVTRGVLADGIGNVLSGVSGGVGINTSTPAVGVAAVTGVVSKYVGYAAGGIFLLLAFLPKIPALFSVMPRAILVAALLFSVTSIIINGLQVMMSRLIDSRRTLVLGLSVVAGVAVEVFPDISASLPRPLSAVASSSLVFATVVALILNAVFRIGVRRRATIGIAHGKVEPKRIEDFLTKQCQSWGARPDVASRAIYSVLQLVDVAAEYGWTEGPLSLTAGFDEFNLDLEISYRGEPLAFPDLRPSADEVRDNPDGVKLLAGYMLRRNADLVQAETRDGLAVVRFHFDH